MVLAPLLYPEKRDILMDRILPDSGGIAKTMMESSLADFMQEVGYGFCTRFVGKDIFFFFFNMKSSTLGAGGIYQDAKGEEKTKQLRVCLF